MPAEGPEGAVKDDEVIGEPKKIQITEDENSFLSTADPDSDEVKAFMASRGIKFDDSILVDVEGRDEPSMLTLSRHDFWTRMKQETFDAIAARKAKEVAELSEPGLAPERHEELREEVAEELGEEAVELTTEVEEAPEESEGPSEVDAEKGEDSEEIKKLLADFVEALPARLGRVREAVDQYDTAGRTVRQLGPVADALHRLSMNMQNYDRGGLNRAIENIAGDIQRVHRIMLNNEENARQISSAIDAAEQDISLLKDEVQKLPADADSEVMYSKGSVFGALDAIVGEEEWLRGAVGRDATNTQGTAAELKRLMHQLQDMGNTHGRPPTEDDIMYIKRKVAGLSEMRGQPVAVHLSKVMSGIQNHLHRVGFNANI